MEYQEPIDDTLSGELSLTGYSKELLLNAASWAKFLAIVGFVFVGLMVILAIFLGSLMSKFSGLAGDSVFPLMGSGFISGIYILMAALYFFPTLYLFQFATKTITAIRSSNNSQLTEGIKNLNATFKFLGIMTIVVLGLYGLGIAGAIVGAMAYGF